MNSLMKLAVKIGIKPIVLIAFIVIGAVIFWGVTGQAKQASTQVTEVQQQSQKQVASLLHASVSNYVASLHTLAESIASSPQLIAAVESNDIAQIAQLQDILKLAIPALQKACVIAPEIDEPAPQACIPISFAGLTALREAKQDGSAKLAIMGLNTEQAHVLILQRIVGANEQLLGVLAIALAPEYVSTMLPASLDANSYAEILQAKGKLVSKGNAGLKQGPASFTRPITGSHWQLAYWVKPNTMTDNAMMPLIIVLAVTAIMLLFLLLWRSLLLKSDASTLTGLIVDLKNIKLKTKYPLAHSTFKSVVDEAKSFGSEMATKPKQTVAARPELVIAEPEAAESQTKSVSEPVEQSNAELTLDIFKSNDIRGIVEKALSEPNMKLLGQALGSEAQSKGIKRLVVARDGRTSSEGLSRALVDGITASGCGVIDIGQAPTPLMYFACQQLGTDSGVIVTGSHNPIEYNGLKIVLNGEPFGGEPLKQLHTRIQNSDFMTGVGSKNTADDIVDQYVEHIVGDIKLDRSMRVVVDAGNAVAGLVAPRLLRELGCEVEPLYCDVDGNFPNHHPNPSDASNLQDLISVVKANGAELGIAFDGDADRVAVVDGEGNIITSDQLMIMFAQDVLSRQPAANILYDVKSSSALAEGIARAGGEAIMTASGHAHIKQKMRETGAQLAGEFSGHFFFKERWFGFDDGIYAAVRLLELLASDPLERSPAEVFAAIPMQESTPEIIIDMAEGESQRFIEQLTAEANFSGAQVITIDGVRAEYTHGWGLVRASNSVPALTLRFEADNRDNLKHIQQEFKQQMLQVKPTLTLNF